MVQICLTGCVYRLLGTIRIRAELGDDVCHQSLALASVDLCHTIRFLHLSLLGLYSSMIYLYF